MPTKTFEYCSLQYLNQWLMYDKGFCDDLTDGNEEKKLTVLKSAGGFYRVARNLPSEYDEKKDIPRYKPILEIIDRLEPEQFKSNPIDEILKIEKKISEQYGNRRVLSLTTKFLWLKLKQPILIYDKQARETLKVKDGDLKEFYKKWHEEFNIHQEKIIEVCFKLPEMNKYAVTPGVQEEYIRELSNKPWFHERIFDIYLWTQGSNINKSTNPPA